jgi:hypothetical protein
VHFVIPSSCTDAMYLNIIHYHFLYSFKWILSIVENTCSSYETIKTLPKSKQFFNQVESKGASRQEIDSFRLVFQAQKL